MQLRGSYAARVNQPVVVQPERLVAGGDALARLEDGRVAFVPGALPGESVRVEVVEERRDFVRARVVEIVEPSVDRVTPSCPHRLAGCGGCSWMHLAPGAQLEAKSGIVAEALRRTGGLDEHTIDTLVRTGGSVPARASRTTVRLAGTGGGLGLREERSDRVVPIDSCEVVHPRLADLLPVVRVAPGTELTLRTSVATGAITAWWATPGRRRKPGRGRASGPPAPAAAEPAVAGLPRGVHIGERAFLDEVVAGTRLRVSAPSFFQPGVAAAELLVDAVERAAPEAATARHALDAYGGVGLFAATTFRSAGHVTLVESAASSVRDAATNLGDRGESVTVVRSEVGAWTAADSAAPIDVVVADPARSGLARPGVTSLAAPAAPVLVLVSCDPVSLARDTRLLGEVGYRPERVEVLDLFPQTHHVETVTRFTR